MGVGDTAIDLLIKNCAVPAMVLDGLELAYQIARASRPFGSCTPTSPCTVSDPDKELRFEESKTD